MIRPDKIGTEYITYYNGSQFRGTIVKDPTKFDFYRLIGLDVFIKNPQSKPLKPLTLEPLKVNDSTPKERKQRNSKTATK